MKAPRIFESPHEAARDNAMDVPIARLSPEARAFLEKSGRGFFVTLRRDGSPTVHPMTALFSGGQLVYTTYRKSAKARNAARDPRTCSLVLADYDDEPTCALVYKGRAHSVDPERFAPAQTASTRPSRQTAASIGERANARLQEGKRVLLGIDADEIALLGLAEVS